MRLRALLTAVFALGVAPGVEAQTGQRSAIQVVVTDPDGGAPISAATITLSGDRLLGGPRAVQASAAGRFVFSGLLPGSYNVAASAKGFHTARRLNIDLPIEATFTVSMRLEIEGVAEHVEVRAAPALIDTQTSATPARLDEPLLHDLPVDRTLSSILGLAPGVTTTSPLNLYVGEVAYGGTQGSNGFTADGVNLTEASLGNPWGSVHYNWLESAQITALGAPAEYGSFTGAIMNGVLRSGSNSVRGLGEWLTIRPGWTADNLEHFPAGSPKPVAQETIVSWWDLNGQAGTPIVKDRLWAFGGFSGVHHEFRSFGYAGPGSTDQRTHLAMVKVDAAPSNNVHLQGFVTRNASDTIGAGIPRPESSPDEFVRQHAWNARVTWMPAAATVFDVWTSGNSGTDNFEPHPPATLAGPSPQTELATGESCCNSYWLYERRSSVLGGVTLDHHAALWRGTHDLKAGFEWERSPVDEQRGVPTNKVLTTQNGAVVQIEEWAGDHSQLTAQRGALYFQDRWRLNDRVTLEPGIRLEISLGSVPGVTGKYVTAPFAPRIGVAWDVNGRQSTVVRAHYGRYHDPLYGAVYQYTQPNEASPHIFYQIADGAPAEVYRYTEEVALPAPSALKQSHVDQFVSGVERSLNANTTVQVQYIGRRFGNFIGWIDLRLSDWTAIPVQDPGPDGKLGTGDDGGIFTAYVPYGDTPDRALVLGNPDNAYRSYNALQLVATRRLARAWQYQVSYTWSQSRGTIGNEYHTNATYTSTSFSGYGADPSLHDVSPPPPRYDYSEFKALGSYRAPWLGGFTTAAVFRWHSGTHWTRMVVVPGPLFVSYAAEPVGSRVTPDVGALDLRLEKTLPMAHAGRFGLYVDFLNATNVGRALAYNQRSGPKFGQVISWTTPRTGRIGIRWSF